MANMSYIRFENTYRDLKDCFNDMNSGTHFSELSETEQNNRNKIVEMCKQIAEQFEVEEIIDED